MISVIIPTFNSSVLLLEAVRSALEQTAPPSEIIVVDDGSSDDTRSRLAVFGTRIKYVYQSNQGVAAARNHGLRLANGELVAFLDADDVWHPRKLEIQIAELMRRPKLGLLGTDVFDWPALCIPTIGPQEPGIVEDISWERLAVKNYFTTSSVLAWRDVLRQVGAFDPLLRGPEDYDLWLRVAEVAGVANLRLPLAGYRTVPGSLSQQAAKMEQGLQRILGKIDARGMWRDRGLLRRKAHSYMRYTCALMYLDANQLGAGLLRLVKSLTWYPLPYRRAERARGLLVVGPSSVRLSGSCSNWGERFADPGWVRLLRAVREQPSHFPGNRR